MTNPFERMGTVQLADPAFPTLVASFAAAGGTPSGSVSVVRASLDQELIEGITDAGDARISVVASAVAVAAVLGRAAITTDLMAVGGVTYELTSVETDTTGRVRLRGDSRVNLTMRAGEDVT